MSCDMFVVGVVQKASGVRGAEKESQKSLDLKGEEKDIEFHYQMVSRCKYDAVETDEPVWASTWKICGQKERGVPLWKVLAAVNTKTDPCVILVEQMFQDLTSKVFSSKSKCEPTIQIKILM